MKTTGMVRKMDSLGRVVLPIELRRTLGIDIKDSIEIYVDKDMVILRKYNPGCIFCGEVGDTLEMSGKPVCTKCARMIAGSLK